MKQKRSEVSRNVVGFVGGPRREGGDGVRRELNPETSFQLHTLDGTTGEEAVSNYPVCSELIQILTEMQK